ncbi:biotin carboxylase N-terminal domain-containing protein [Algiphilus sp. W345]|uniref:Biotin carboxylase N-terminal domain-containing protein n=1 Tax=Banduia mediterranea TaxID=3075609 RepID=A0ABU2WFT8_9GAMM|nr:biotin carboxylase N-terminal domain-containing protein [Algiphilus sp. W345]MDT0496390.1 biotin carboxylase N-terminal domain-containing protein [Algiphilus sp. W345]
MFKKILIANRGEIACRIARTCRRLGVAVAGVHSTADRDGLHVREIGQSIEIGGAPAAESYLRIERVIEAAKSVGAQAIHPGFGFLAENAAFARAVEAAGLAFIGPTPEVIDRLGDKALAKHEAIAAGVPVVPGSEGASEDAARIEQTVRGLALPVMLKAAAGGGGKGMRVLRTLEGLAAEIESAMREAKNSFGSPALIVEQMIEHARHIEVQIVGDGQGKVLHLFERECTLQRRHQKLIEEAPAAPLAPGVRERLLADAVRLGERLQYRNVGTVEFIVQGERYYFLEVNPRLQVEHPVTEEITGLDVVELMLRIAAGEGLALEQAQVQLRGHAVETRICAEDAAANFLPSTGRLAYVRFPEHGVRVEAGVDSGSEVTPWYDPMIAKLITHAPTRGQALDRMALALDEMSVFGVVTNRDFLKKLLSLDETRDASFHTRLIDERIAGWNLGMDTQRQDALAVAAYAWLMQQRAASPAGVWSSAALTGWQMADDGVGLAPIPALHLHGAQGSAAIRFAPLSADGTLRLAVDEQTLELDLRALGDGRYLAILGTRRFNVRVVTDGVAVHVQDEAGTHSFEALPYLSYISASTEASGELRAPMMGMILKVNVKAGDAVKAGDVVAVLESMKMEMRICAEADGVVESTHCTEGQTVERNAVVVRIGKAA